MKSVNVGSLLKKSSEVSASETSSSDKCLRASFELSSLSHTITPEPLSAPFITTLLSFFKECKASRSSLLRLLNLSLGILISRSLSCKKLKFVSVTSLFYGLNVDFTLDFLLQSKCSFMFSKFPH